MSLHPQEISPVPEETRRVARAAFPRGNIYMRMRDELCARISGLRPARGVALTPGLDDRDAIC